MLPLRMMLSVTPRTVRANSAILGVGVGAWHHTVGRLAPVQAMLLICYLGGCVVSSTKESKVSDLLHPYGKHTPPYSY